MDKRIDKVMPGLLVGVAFAMASVLEAAPSFDKSGVTPNTISLPEGPGSIEGLGESFEPMLNNGTARHAIAVPVPPGTAGHTPALVLQYDSGNGNGPLGYGWDLPVPFIQRQTDKGLPRYVDGTNGLDDDLDGIVDNWEELDVFIDDTKEELVPMANGYYFTENQTAFVRYERVGDHWEGTRPNGTRLYFGETSNGRVEDPATGHVFKWMLEREVDVHGNIIHYAYARFPGEENTNQVYLSTVSYGPGASPWNHYHVVKFEYGSRSDRIEDYRSTFVVRTGMRLTNIVVGTHTDTLPGHARRDLDGDYINRGLALEYRPGHRSFLSSVTIYGSDGVSSLPPARFEYGVVDSTNTYSAAGHIIGGVNEPPVVPGNGLVDLLDANGDALPDLLRTALAGGVHQVFINQGVTNTASGSGIMWSEARQMDSADGLAWNINLDDAGNIAHLSDQDGDGASDLWYKTPAQDIYYFENTLSNGWGVRKVMSIQDYVPPAPFGSDDVRTADVDNDKRIDIIQSVGVGGGAYYRVWYNLGNQTYSRRSTQANAQGLLFNLSGVDLADMNGDRLADIVRIRPSTVEVLPAQGYGRFAGMETIPIPTVTLTDSQVGRAKLRDITGDGLADLVLERAEPGVLWFWINLGNDTFASRCIITGMPTGQGTGTAVRWADMNGNGTTDLVYCDASMVPRIQSVDIGELIGYGPGQNLLTLIDNGIGGLTRIVYDTSTRCMLADWDVAEKEAGQRAWPDPLPFPVTVVSQVVGDNSAGNTLTNDYCYHDGYYDSVEKEFRGFARVEVLNRGDASCPTLVNRYRFDTGRDYEAMKGKVLELSAEQEDEGVFHREYTRWSDPPRQLMAGQNGQPVWFAHAVASSNQVLELGNGVPKWTESEFAYDDYGNELTNANYGIVENGDRSAWNDERIIVTEYATNTDAWILNLPALVEVQDEAGAVTSRTRYYYDDPTFSGSNPGQVSLGDLTLTRQWIDPENSSDYVDSLRNTYDGYGNITAILDPLASAPGGVPNPATGHFREIAYDGQFHALPVAETIHVGNGSAPLRIGAAYDAGMGTVVSATNFNGHPSFYQYDVYGRLTGIERPGDTPGYPSVAFDYVLAESFVSGGHTGTVNYVQSRALDKEPGSPGSTNDHFYISRTFVDGMGRTLMTKSEAGTNGVTVTGAVILNARGKPSVQFNPYYAAGLDFEDVTAPGWLGSTNSTEVLYDAMLRPIRTINPDDTFSRIEYEPLLTINYDENDANSTSPYFNTPLLHYSDGLGRLARVDEITHLNDDGIPSGGPTNWATLYEYDLNDNLTRIKDSQNNVKTFAYDGLKRKTFMNDPDRGVMHWSYDAAGNLIEQKDAKEQVIQYGYDGANRLVSEDYLDEGLPFSANRSPDVEYHYDEPANGTAENVKGHLAYVVDLSGEEHASYDARSRVAWAVKRIPNPDTGQLESFATHSTNDPMDRVTEIQYPDGDVFHYVYNDRNALARIYGDTTGDIIADVTYRPSGQVDYRDYGNNVRTSYSYDSRLRMTFLNTEHRTLNTPLLHFGYTFDDASNIRRIDDLRPGSAVPEGDPLRNTQIFQYDDLYRLTRAQYSFNLPGNPDLNDGVINYRYDRIGNMLEKNSSIDHVENGLPITDVGLMESGGSLGTWNRTNRAASDPGPHALSSILHPPSSRLYHYDSNGNMLDIDGLHCTWDFLDRLVAVSNASMVARYTYDFTGRRVRKQVVEASNPQTTNTTTYVNRFYEIREGQPIKYVWDGETRVARITGFQTQQYNLQAGWNLCSIAVQSTNAAAQLGVGGPSVEHCFRWVGPPQDWEPVEAADPLPAGSVFWLKAVSDMTVSVSGFGPALADTTVRTNSDFLPCPGRADVPLDDLVPPGVEARVYDATEGRWRARYATNDIAPESDVPAVLQSGQAIAIGVSTSTVVRMPDPVMIIRYYHQDHLGSSGIITDESGELVESTAYYPFGHPRYQYQPKGLDEPYGYIQKEQDIESGLHYFEARYLAASLGRFVGVDPLRMSQDLFPDRNARLSYPYLYAEALPITQSDPTGMESGSEINEIGDIIHREILELALKEDDPKGIEEALKGVTEHVIHQQTGAYAVLEEQLAGRSGDTLESGVADLHVSVELKLLAREALTQLQENHTFGLALDALSTVEAFGLGWENVDADDLPLGARVRGLIADRRTEFLGIIVAEMGRKREELLANVERLNYMRGEESPPEGQEFFPGIGMPQPGSSKERGASGGVNFEIFDPE